MNIKKIRNNYNSEFDLPNSSSPPVTWVEMELAESLYSTRQILHSALIRLSELEFRISELEEALLGD